MVKFIEPVGNKDRFKRTVTRIAAEAFWLRTYQAAIEGMRVEAIGLDFFRVSLNALKDARLIRLMRVLEDDSRTASFWYLVRSNERLLRQCAKESNLDIDFLRAVADKLRGIRDKTFVHVDREGVFDPPQYYKAANITHDDVKAAIDGLWATMRAVHMVVFGEDVKHSVYTGEDILELARLRDASA